MTFTAGNLIPSYSCTGIWIPAWEADDLPTELSLPLYDVNGNITADIEKVLNRWKLGFEDLLNRPGEVGFENSFNEKCNNDKINIEQDIENEYFISNPQLIHFKASYRLISNSG